MSFDRIDPADLAALTPEERVAVEGLLLEAAVRRDNARRPAVDPIVREHAEACVKAILGDPPMPLSREAEAALLVAWREMARGILEREMAEAGPDPAP